jgi:hypothetical protein
MVYTLNNIVFVIINNDIKGQVIYSRHPFLLLLLLLNICINSRDNAIFLVHHEDSAYHDREQVAPNIDVVNDIELPWQHYKRDNSST